MRRSLLAGLAILIAWMLLDVLLHGLFLAPLYDASRELWRPFDQMNVMLIYAASLVLIAPAAADEYELRWPAGTIRMRV